jgi:2-C-methyl-D-erythritol 4-phosphate cytidylyltransferase
MNKTYAVILAGGMGLRLGRNVPKQLLPLGERPVIAKTIDMFHSMNEIDDIIVVMPGDLTREIHEIIDKHGFVKVLKVVTGGSTRQGSVNNALNSHDYKDEDILIFHDAARPFVTKDIIASLIRAVNETGAAGTYVKAIDTITEITGDQVISIPDRKNLFYTQTPQGFRYRIIKKAHTEALASGITDATDDVTLALRSGFTVKAVTGEYSNFKITTENDYRLALHITGS